MPIAAKCPHLTTICQHERVWASSADLQVQKLKLKWIEPVREVLSTPSALTLKELRTLQQYLKSRPATEPMLGLYDTSLSSGHLSRSWASPDEIAVRYLHDVVSKECSQWLWAREIDQVSMSKLTWSSKAPAEDLAFGRQSHSMIPSTCYLKWSFYAMMCMELKPSRVKQQARYAIMRIHLWLSLWALLR